VYDEFGYWVDSSETDSNGNRRITTNDCEELLELEFSPSVSPSAESRIKFGIKLDNGTAGSPDNGTAGSSAAVTIADVFVDEYAGTASVMLSLDNAVQGGFSVDVSASGGTAMAGTDYTLQYQSLTFMGFPGETQTVSLYIYDDMEIEGYEWFYVTMSNSSIPGVSIWDNATVTIADDDY